MKIVIDLQPLQTDSRNRGIGRYSLALARAMISEGKGHDFYVILNHSFPESIDSVRQLFADLLPPEKIMIFRTPAESHRSELEGHEFFHSAAEMIREHFLENIHPDWIHISSLFEPVWNSALASIGRFTGILTSATLYDLIPYNYPERYLTSPPYKTLYMSQFDYLRKADLLLAISGYTRQNAIESLHLPADRVINISTDADPNFRILRIDNESVLKLRAHYGISREFVMYIGGNEYRKNIEGLIEAYANLPVEVRAKHQLVICCDLQGEQPRLVRLASHLGLTKDEVVLPGYVSDEDLVSLCNLCKLFVFPSLYEGFGLPVLEAMRCGAPVIGSDSTSIPEVIGFKEALFDPTSPTSICKKIYQALTDDRLRQHLRDHGQVQAAKFSWKISAQRSLDAMEAINDRRQHARHISEQTISSQSKPRLAYFSPLPPEKSGIADYSAELLPELSRYYEIDLVTDLDQTTDPWLEANLRRVSMAEFQRRAKEYDRVLYHFGNSEFHSHMFPLLKKYPGTVVLHDFFLGNILRDIEDKTPGSTIFQQALYDSHGYSALRNWRAVGSSETAWNYPCCLWVLEQAQGVIVHSQYSLQLAAKFFSFGKKEYLAKIPHLRRLPGQISRTASRKILDLPEQAFLVCSFGILGLIKQNDTLLNAWSKSDLGRDERCQLIFVGAGQGNEYERSLRERIKAADVNSRVKITGYVDAKTYQHYLAAANLAVQLRTRSRGETSGTVLDCLSHGLVTIVNNHGSLAELPADVVYKLSDQFDFADLASALEQLHNDSLLCETLARNAVDYIKMYSDPPLIARQYSEAIESFAENHPIAVQRRLLTAITALPIKELPKDNELAEMAESIAENNQSQGKRQLLVDISVLVGEDIRTGIQRVTRSIIQQLLAEAPDGYRMEPIYRSEGLYRYARHFMQGFLEIPDLGLEDMPVDMLAGDTFLGLDLDPGIDEPARKWLRYHSERGLKVYFIIYDMLPLFNPEFFSPERHQVFKTWLERISNVANGIICISKSTAEELGRWLTMYPLDQTRPLLINYFHLGADIESSLPSSGMTSSDKALLAKLNKKTAVLMVGTIEPRKGYSQVVEAFDELWKKGEDPLLVIAGKRGWKTEDLVKHLRAHPELGKHLFWYEKASDELLLKLYDNTSALLMASEGEGFGLPLIEAARHGLPIIARDLPVFREVAGDYAFYFKGRNSIALSESLKTWLDLYRKGEHPRSDGMHWLTWEQSARQLKQIIFGSQWRASWDPKNGFCWQEETSPPAALPDSSGSKDRGRNV